MSILNQIRLNEEQRQAVEALRQGQVAVTAGAGTGKTRTLVAAYLMLLQETDDVRRIAAITFTRKAAHEMRNRVRQEIRAYLQTVTLDPGERHRWEKHYRRLDAARIGTIHSLCADVLRTHPAEAAVDPAFGVLEETDTARLQAQAVADALAWGASDPDTAALFTLLGERDLRTLLLTLLGSRLETKKALAACVDDPLAHWQHRLNSEKEQAVESCLAEATELLDGVNHYRAADANDLLEQRRSEAEQLVRRARTARQAGEIEQAVSALLALSAVSHTGGSKQQWDEEERELVRAGLKAAKAAIGDYPVLQSSLNGADEEAAQLLPPLARLFERADGHYEQLKQQQQSLDFDDLEARALALLGNAAPRDYWQEQLVALLVDEYQDTNDRQRQLINGLSYEGRRFIVGDAKQSIYRFRGADVSVFNEEQLAIGRAGGRLTALQTSYRARPPLLELLNLLLEPALYEKHPRPYHAPFAALYAPEPLPPTAPERPLLESPFLEVHLALGNQSEGAAQAAAHVLAERVQQLVETVPHLTYGDVAVLCRAVSAFEPYEEAFVCREIPYTTSSGSGFYERPEIRDLLNALQAIARPADERALIGLLRSPVLALSDVVLHEMALVEGGSWWERLAASPLPQAQRAYGLLERLRREAPLLPAAKLLARFLKETDYMAALTRAGQPRAARNVRKLLADLQQSGHIHLSDYLQWADEMRQTNIREGEAPAAAANAVHLLTVHAAKGLEFEVVAIGHVNYAPRSRAAPLIDPEWGLLLPLGDDEASRPAVYRLGYEQEQKQDDAERRRLLYVAATRARQKLLLSGYFRSLTKKGTPGYLSDWLKWLAEPLALDKTHIADVESSRPVPVPGLALEDTACTIYPPGSVAEPEPRTAPETDETSPSTVTPLLHPLPYSSPPPALAMERPWYVAAGEETGEPARLVGTLVHAALARWHFPGEAEFERWLEARACAAGLVSARRQQAAVARASLLLRRFQECELFARLDAAVRYHELPYYLAAGNGQQGTRSIDLLYQDREGRWAILDFKTNQLAAGTDLNRWCRETVEDGRSYFDQLEEYAGALKRLLPLPEPPSASLCLLDYDGRVRLFTPS